jgi:hypothetical protein
MKLPHLISRVALAVALVWVSGIVGLFVGGASVTRDAGLAGGAIVLGYGVIGAGAGLLVGAFLAWTMPVARLRTAVVLALVLALGSTAAVVVRGRQAREAREARAAAEAAARRAPFTASVVTHNPNDGAAFVRIDVDGATDTFVMTARRRPGRPVCRGTVDERRHARLVDVLRRSDVYLDEHPGACSDLSDPQRIFRWSLPERGNTPRVVNLSVACGQAHSQLLSLYSPFESIAFSADRSPDGLTCEPAAP